MKFSPLVYQILVVSATQLAALSVGGVTTYPAVLLLQLKAKDSSIALDEESASWIASVHGFSGALSIVVPMIMQMKGRRLTFILSHITVIIGWLIIYFAQDATTIIIGEAFHGLGCNMFHIVGLIAISEMLSPKLRNISMPVLNVNLVIGMSLARFSSYVMHWKTISIIFCIPLIITMTLVYMWPESPFWLAYRGELEQCKQSFTRLRGTDDESRKELALLIKKQTELLHESKCKNVKRKSICQELLQKIQRRDFYIPCIHVIVIMLTHYWSGAAASYIFAREIFERATKTNSLSSIVVMIMDTSSVVCAILSCVAVKYFDSKTVILTSIGGCAASLLGISIVTYCQKIGVLPETSTLVMYFMISNMMFYFSGWLILSFSISTEIMPVKHRGIGGAVLLAISCVFHSTTLKLFPYMLQYLDLYGTNLIYCASCLIGFLYIKMVVPKTKGKTLQEIEDFYNNGHLANETQRFTTQEETLSLSIAETDET